MESTGKALSILVVDDHTGAANALGRLLRVCGHAVHVCHSALEGRELAARIRPDLILHDLQMPGIDGYEAARRLREVPSLCDTLLIAFSASIDELNARETGFDGWLEKPISHNSLDTVIAMAQSRIAENASGGENNPLRRAQA